MAKVLLLTILCSFFHVALAAQKVDTPRIEKPFIELQYGADRTDRRHDPAMERWRSNRFGQFVHWGLYAIPGGVWNGKTYPGAAEWLKSWAKVPTAEWDALAKQFNPTNFDAREWARIAKSTGAKYMVITTKHHEGFSLWDSKYSDFDVAATPFKRDIIRELVEAYNAEGIDVGFYYSVLDWHHPDWRYDIKSEADAEAFTRYLEFAKNQLRELAENYPTVKTFWFDGTWDESVKKNGKWTFEVEKMLKEIRPGVIINSRLRADDYGARGKDSNGYLMADYDSGYERKLPAPYENWITRIDWEACMTIPTNQWGYHREWNLSHVKTSNELLEMISRTAALNGNFLLNFGPGPDGRVRPEEQQIAREIGGWMQANGEAIYGAGYAGLEHQNWGYYTRSRKTGAVYMVVFNMPVTKKLRVVLPSKQRIADARLLGSNVPLNIETLGDDQYFITTNESNFTQPLVIKLKLEAANSKK